MKKLLSLLAVALIAVVAVGCGGSNDSDSSTSSASTTTDADRGDQVAIRDCLEEHGIDVPERPQGGPPADGELPEGGPPPGAGQGPSPGGFPGADGDEIRQALKDCGIDTPRGGMRPPQNNAAFRAAIQKYLKCMRSNGAELPDPNLSGNGPVFDDNDVDRQDPAFVKANRACQNHLRPNPQQQG